MFKLPPQIEAFIAPLLKTKSAAAFRSRLDGAASSIVARMAKDKPRDKGQRHGIRYVLYWQAKALVRSGELADLWRDAIDDKIVSIVEPTAAGMTDEALVAAVAQAFTEQVF